MLVISAVPLARSLAVQVGVDVGFSADRLVAAEVAPSPVCHPNDAVRLEFYANLERRLRALPFVGGVGLSTAFQPFGAVRGGSVFRIVIGEIGAAVLMSSLFSQLFGVGPWDPLTYAAVPVLFVALAVTAAWLPARRATKLDPVAVLRAE